MVIDCQGSTIYNDDGVSTYTLADTYDKSGTLDPALTASQQARVCTHISADGDASDENSEPSSTLTNGNPTGTVCKTGYFVDESSLVGDANSAANINKVQAC